MNAASSRGVAGARPYCVGEHGPADLGADPGPLRRGEGGVPGTPRAGLACAARRATSTRNAGTVVRHGVRPAQPGRVPGARSRPGVRPAVSICARMASALGCRPSPNRAVICASVTGPRPASRHRPGRSPTQRPGDSPCCGVVGPQAGVPAVGGVLAQRPAGSGTCTRPRRSACESTAHSGKQPTPLRVDTRCMAGPVRWPPPQGDLAFREPGSQERNRRCKRCDGLRLRRCVGG